MLYLNQESVQNAQAWSTCGVTTPRFNIQQMRLDTQQHPTWVHVGAGNLFRGFIANLQHSLLEQGKVKQGIIAVETFDHDIIEQIYKPFDHLTLLALMHPDGRMEPSIVAGVAAALHGSPEYESDFAQLRQIFQSNRLQMVSFTITEKGYAVQDPSGHTTDTVLQDAQCGPDHPTHVMSIIASLMLVRYQHGAYPLALVSMDNCSDNGLLLKHSIHAIAAMWYQNGHVEDGFLQYLNNPHKVSYPCSMIDKITPRPSEHIQAQLEQAGILGMSPITTRHHTYIAPFVNAEVLQYLVIQDDFPNGRPPLEDAGVLFTDLETVHRTEKMKVATCLNPLHTALAVFGCLLGYTSIAQTMQDPQLKKLAHTIGIQEGMKVVTHPGVIDPQQFIQQVVQQRLPNPYIPDSPQRIAVDTSQKIAVRFGQTIQAYHDHPTLRSTDLTGIPLVLAGWLRYLLGIDDQGAQFQLSPDPLLDSLTHALAGITLGTTDSCQQKLTPILKNQQLFGVDLDEVGLADRVQQMFLQMIAGTNAVRETLRQYL